MKNLANLEPMGPDGPSLTLYKKRRKFYEECNSMTVYMAMPASPTIITCGPEFMKGVLGTKSRFFTDSYVFRTVFG